MSTLDILCDKQTLNLVDWELLEFCLANVGKPIAARVSRRISASPEWIFLWDTVRIGSDGRIQTGSWVIIYPSSGGWEFYPHLMMNLYDLSPLTEEEARHAGSPHS